MSLSVRIELCMLFMAASFRLASPNASQRAVAMCSSIFEPARNIRDRESIHLAKIGPVDGSGCGEKGYASFRMGKTVRFQGTSSRELLRLSSEGHNVSLAGFVDS